MSHFGWIRAEREARGLSQANLSRLLGISQPRLSQWETGKATPPQAEVGAVQRVLHALDASVGAGRLPAAIRPRTRRRVLSAVNGARLASQVKLDEVGEQAAVRLNCLADFSRRRQAAAKPTGIALFAGCGGMSLGFRQAGFDVRGFLEVDPGARAIYQRNLPDAVCLGADVCAIADGEVRAWRKHLGPVDVLFGGPPCQGFSLTGKRDRRDPRNELYARFARIAGMLRPRAILLENVRLLTSMKAADGSSMLDRIHEAFAQAGYACRHALVNARDFGVPQFRDRLFLVGVRDGTAVTFPAPTHGPRGEPYVTFRDACGDLESLESGERSATDPLHFAVAHPEHVLKWLRGVPEGASAHDNPDPRLRPPCGYNTTYKRIRWDEPCSTIGTTFGMISASRNVHPTNTRSLTVREAARCQTFPDDFCFVGNLGTIRTAIGNAVPPRLAKAVAAHLYALIRRSRA